MLQLTDSAKDAVRAMVSGEGGLRIASEGDEGLTIDVADGPSEGDTVIEEDGVRVYVEAAAAALLDDQVLDAEGHDDHFHFGIGPQDPSG